MRGGDMFGGDMLGGGGPQKPAKADKYGGATDPFGIAKAKIKVVKCSHASCGKLYVPTFLEKGVVTAFVCSCGAPVNLGGGALDLMGGSPDGAVPYTDVPPRQCPLLVSATFGEMSRAVQVSYLTRLQKAKEEEELQLQAHRARLAAADAVNDATVDIEKELEPRLDHWAHDHGELRDIRALLAQFHTLANWPGAQWEPVAPGALFTDPKLVKALSRKILQKFHPDKIEPDAPIAERVVCGYCSEKVRQAFRKVSAVLVECVVRAAVPAAPRFFVLQRIAAVAHSPSSSLSLQWQKEEKAKKRAGR